MATKTAKDAAEAHDEPKTETEETTERRRQPVRIEPLELEGAFEGWRFSANRNFYFGELEELLSWNYYRMLPVLKKLVTGWDNFVDRDGNELAFVPVDKLPPANPPTLAGEFPYAKDPWREITTDLMVAMARAIVGLPSVPNR